MEYIAIDIGGSQIKSGIVDTNGEIRNRNSVETPKDADPAALLQLLHEIVSQQQTEATAGIGISTLGAVDGKRGMVVGACSNLPGIYGLPLKESLEQAFHVPVSVRNDVDAAALGEAFYGAGKGLEQFYCLTLGTGIGGAFVFKGQVLSGANGLAGEIGYIHRAHGGCYEDRASVSAFLRMCRENGETRTSGRAIFASAMAGEANAELYAAWIRNIASGICEIIYTLDPGTVIIGGGVSCHGSLLCDPIQAAVEQRLLPDFRGKTRIMAAAAGNNANLLGATVGFLPRIGS